LPFLPKQDNEIKFQIFLFNKKVERINMLQYKRSERLGEMIQKEISDILHRRIKDPRVDGLCTVMKVDVSEDLRHAKVSVSVMGTEQQQKNTLIGLKNASGFIRREIGHRIELRYTPELTFILDKSVEYGIQIDQLIKKFREENQEID